METFKQRMKRIRLRAGFNSQGGAAAVIGCERGTVSMWEAPSSNVQGVSSEWLFAVAKAYKVRPEWINAPRSSDDGYPWTPGARTEHPEPVTPPHVSGAPASQFGRPDPVTLGAALDLLAFDEDQAGRYSPQSRAERLADLYVRIAADGGVRLSSENNALFDDEVRARESRAQGKDPHGAAATTTRRRG